MVKSSEFAFLVDSTVWDAILAPWIEDCQFPAAGEVLTLTNGL